MKRIKKSIWVALIVLASQANATDVSSSLNVVKTGTKSFDLSMSNVRGNVQLFLKNDKNQGIYNRTFKTNNSLRKRFDMSLFQDGVYTMELEDAQKVVSLTIVIENDTLTIDDTEQKTQFLPVIHLRDKIVSINKLALDDELVTIRVMDQFHELIHEKTLRGSGNLGQRYDFSQSLKGTYTFAVETGNKTIYREVKIK